MDVGYVLLVDVGYVSLVLMSSSELLDDVCQMESRFGLFGDNVSFGAR